MRLSDIKVIFAAAMTIVMAACSHSDSFTITGDVAQIGNSPVSLTYYTEGGVRSISANALDGKFVIQGESPDFAPAELRAAHSTMAFLIVRNGDKIKITGPSPDSITVKGSKQTSNLYKIFAQYPGLTTSEPSKEVNDIVEAIVSQQGVNPVTAYLIFRFYDTVGFEHRADSILSPFLTDNTTAPILSNFVFTLSPTLAKLQAISPINIMAHGDSMMKYNPARHNASLIAIVNDKNGGTGDSSRKKRNKKLEDLTSLSDSLGIRVIELSLAGDSTLWKQTLRRDTTARWTRAYVPGGAAAPIMGQFSVTSLPLYVAVDARGYQRYRGKSLEAASDTLIEIARQAASKGRK